jgi:hypothetical protein
MIKRSLFFAIILLPCIAYGADPSSNLSTNVVPPGSSPPVPAGAAAAGFTTLALNSDFTQPQAANWLGGCSVAGNGAPTNSSDNTGHNWYLNIWWSNTYQNCGVVQVSDPAFGGTVLDMPWVSKANWQQIGTVIQSAPWFSTGTAGTFPNNAYYEITMRMTPIANGAYAAFYTWPVLAMTDTSKAGLEIDVIEEDAGNLGNSDGALHNWGQPGTPGAWLWLGKGSPGLPSNFDPNQYHKFAARSTSDGTNQTTCSYIDDVFQQCVAIPGGMNANNQVARYFLIVQNACDWWNYPSNFCNGQNQHMYVKSVKVWSCPSWQTTQCNGPVDSSSP